MTTEQDSQKIETELQAILGRLTAEHEEAKGLVVEIKKLDEDTDALEQHVNASEKDIAVFLENQSKELDSLVAEEQKEMKAEKIDIESEE
jgi:hypothetical protein